MLQSARGPALQLLTAFMESYEQIPESCWDDDFGTSELLNRARTMIEKLAATLPAEDVGAALGCLRDELTVPVAR